MAAFKCLDVVALSAAEDVDGLIVALNPAAFAIFGKVGAFHCGVVARLIELLSLNHYRFLAEHRHIESFCLASVARVLANSSINLTAYGGKLAHPNVCLNLGWRWFRLY